MASVKMNVTPTRNDRYRRAFGAIYEFVTQLNETFGSSTKVTPIGLYKRLMDKVVNDDIKAIDRFVNGFNSFFDQYKDWVLRNEMDRIPSGTMIRYNSENKGQDRVYIPIEVIYRKSDSQTKSIIRQHLLNIGSHLNDQASQSMTDALKQAMANPVATGPPIDVSTITNKEQEFIEFFTKRVKDLVGSQTEEVTPESIIRLMMDGGLVNDITSWVTANASSIDMQRLVGLLSQQLTSGLAMS